MQADWEVEIGAGAPVIEACWPGFVDLQSSPLRAWDLPETADMPALAEALIRLNAPDSPVWTTKCDFWPRLESSAFDPLELEAPPGCATHAAGCYIDLLARSPQRWASTEMTVSACRRFCALVHAHSMAGCRVDLVLRRAFFTPDQEGLGVTAYLTACGPSAEDAGRNLADALAVFARACCADATLQ